jgi:hypothetical protein
MITAGAMVFSLVAGITGGLLFDRTSVAQNWSQRQNAEDRKRLEWAKSPEGEFAQNLLMWNEDLFSKSCQEKAQNLGISFDIGSQQMTDGFCVVFVVPESQRRYENKE